MYFSCKKIFSLKAYLAVCLVMLFTQGVGAEKEVGALTDAQFKATQKAEKDRDANQACDDAQTEFLGDKDTKKSKRKDLMDEFHDLEEKISGLEAEQVESKATLTEEITSLKNQAEEDIQNLKDSMGSELEGLDDSIKKLQAKISELTDEVHKLDELRMESFYKKRASQNTLYATCYDKAMERTVVEKKQYKQRARAGTLRKKSLSDVTGGGKLAVNQLFQKRFNTLLNQCLTKQGTVTAQKNAGDQHELMLKKMDNQKIRIQQKIQAAKKEIAQLKTSKKTKVLTDFKEKMEKAVAKFSAAYDAAVKKHEGESKRILAEIQKIKTQQAGILREHGATVPEKVLIAAYSEKCEGIRASLNGFNSDGTRKTSGSDLFAPPTSVTR